MGSLDQHLLQLLWGALLAWSGHLLVGETLASEGTPSVCVR